MWFIFALITTLAWAVADLFYKKGTDKNDKLSQWRIVMMVGLVMGIHGIIYWIYKVATTDFTFDLFNIVKYLPVSACYIISMIFGYVGIRYIEYSIGSPVGNTSGAIVAVLCFVFLDQSMSLFSIFSTVLVVVGMLGLAVAEKREDIALRRASGESIEKKYTTGFVALLFPVLYALIDALGTFADVFYLDGTDNIEPLMTEDEVLIAYEMTFFLCAVVAFIYIRFIRGEKIRIKQEKFRFLAGCAEMTGQVAYVFALTGGDDGNSGIVAAPMIASYSVISVLLLRIFAKEKLTWIKYVMIGIVLAGILLLGIEEGLAM